MIRKLTVDAKTRYRIFLSYRGESQGTEQMIGKEFEEKLYDYLNADPFSIEKYGNVYLSTREEIAENFLGSISRVMKNVEYFVLPMTRRFFDDFEQQGERSVTYQEIMAAFKNKNMRFVAIAFPGFEMTEELQQMLRRIFKQNADKLIACKLIPYDSENELETIRVVAEQLIRSNYRIRNVKEFLKAPNVHMAFKRDMEDPQEFPFYERMYDVKKVMLMNFAASSFLAGSSIAKTYQSSKYFTKGFQSRLLSGDVQIEAVLTNPYSAAALDAELYKMYPNDVSADKSEIIMRNLNKFYSFKTEAPDSRMRVHLTNIMLPYGLMITEHENPENNHMKVDLYAPLPGDDRYRPSFYLVDTDPDTKELYSFFKNNFFRILQEHSFLYDRHPDIKWILEKPIIHRGQWNKDVMPHTRNAILDCIQRKFTIEVDLMQLKDRSIVVCRHDEYAQLEGYPGEQIQNLTWIELKQQIDENGEISSDQVMTIEEFLDYVHGYSSILLEVKSDEYDSKNVENQLLVDRLVKVIRKYMRKYVSGESKGKVAVHSANPYILKMIREKDCMIPLGQISLDFSTYKEGLIDEDIIVYHKEMKFLDEIVPDFIGYRIEDIADSKIEKYCESYGIPLIGWTVKDKEIQKYSENVCDNIIIEGAETYL